MADGENAFRAQFVDPDTGSRWFAGLHLAQTVIETGATPNELTVRTTYPGDRRAAVERMTVELTNDGRISRAIPVGKTPLWTTGTVSASRAANGSLLSIGLDAAQRQRWVDRMDAAVGAVRRSGVVDPALNWDGGVVLEIPSTSADFAAVSGIQATNTAAVTSCTTGTARIVVNPAAFAQSAEWLTATVTHEAVHVAVESPCAKGTLWVVEGMAESVAASSDPATATSNAELVRTFVAAHGVPAALPQRLVNQTDYALAQVAADQVRAKLGPRASATFFRQGVRGPLTAAQTSAATGWYRAALRPR